jgi:hypothetical protein
MAPKKEKVTVDINQTKRNIAPEHFSLITVFFKLNERGLLGLRRVFGAKQERKGTPKSVSATMYPSRALSAPLFANIN